MTVKRCSRNGIRFSSEGDDSMWGYPRQMACPSCDRIRSSPEWQRARKEALERDQKLCRECGGGAPDVAVEVHHVRPLHKGGEPFGLWNLVTLCADCHSEADRVALAYWQHEPEVHHFNTILFVGPHPMKRGRRYACPPRARGRPDSMSTSTAACRHCRHSS